MMSSILHKGEPRHQDLEQVDQIHTACKWRTLHCRWDFALSMFLSVSIICSFQKKTSHALLNHLVLVSMLRQDVQLPNIGLNDVFPWLWQIGASSPFDLQSSKSPQTPPSRGGLHARAVVQISYNTRLSDWGVAVDSLDTVTPRYSLHWDSKNYCENHTFPNKPISF